jgi:hypothetical protein
MKDIGDLMADIKKYVERMEAKFIVESESFDNGMLIRIRSGR